MSRNGSGIYVPPANSWNPAINGGQATAADWQALLQDISNALTQSVASDGQTPMTGSLNMGGNRLINLGAPQGQGHALRYQQLAQGGDLNSSSDVVVPNEGAYFNVKGTSTIETFSGSFPGRRVTLRFEDELTLLASIQMVLPGNVDYQTEAGEILEVIQISPGIWQLITSGGGAGIGGPGRQMVITSSGNIVLPASRIWVTGCAKGGNGGNNSGSANPGAGGGGGALFIRREFQVTRGSTVMATLGSSTSLDGIFTLAGGSNASGASAGAGGAASSQGTGGISAAGAAGGGRTLGSNGIGGGGGGSLGGGGAGGVSSDGEHVGVPGGVEYGTSPKPGSTPLTGAGGQGIGVGWGGLGGYADTRTNASGGKGSWGAGGGGAGGNTSNSPGQGGDPIIVIEW